MAPSHLQGLNLVYPEPQHSQPFISDADLLAIPNYPPELAAQLDLWTNLAFQSDEPSSRSDASAAREAAAEDEEEDDEGSPRGPAQPSAHENVVTGTAVESIPAAPVAQHPALPSASQFDLHAFLASMGMPPHVQLPNGTPPPPGVNAPSLASILALYSTMNGQHHPMPLNVSPVSASTAETSPAGSAGPRPAKRARSRKASVAPPLEAESPADFGDEYDDDPSGASLSTSANPTEDKRRRNTAASARFRAKKKEREAALEKKAKDLEGRVGDLERECEALRRENGWLKGLVVGVTGAGASQSVVAAPAVPVGTKRRRDDA